LLLFKQNGLVVLRVTPTLLNRNHFALRLRNVSYKLNFYVLCAATLKVLLVSLAKRSAVRVSRVRVSTQ
jgi:hypothetical protein